jgi:hypothetical protein
MPEFLDEFAASLAPKKDAVKEKVLKGTPNPLVDRFREMLPHARLVVQLFFSSSVAWFWVTSLSVS